MTAQEREYEEAMVSSKAAREAYERFSAQAAEAAREAAAATRTKDAKLECTASRFGCFACSCQLSYSLTMLCSQDLPLGYRCNQLVMILRDQLCPSGTEHISAKSKGGG